MLIQWKQHYLKRGINFKDWVNSIHVCYKPWSSSPKKQENKSISYIWESKIIHIIESNLSVDSPCFVPLQKVYPYKTPSLQPLINSSPVDITVYITWLIVPNIPSDTQ